MRNPCPQYFQQIDRSLLAEKKKKMQIKISNNLLLMICCKNFVNIVLLYEQ